MTFFTIGYGGRSPTTFLQMLHDVGVRTVVDVRLRPDRASLGCYTKARSPDKGIEALLHGSGIGYLSLIELGNLFLDEPDWPALYRKLLEQSGALLTRRLESAAQPFCLLCAEKKVTECHRRLIADYLVGQGHEVHHLE